MAGTPMFFLGGFKLSDRIGPMWTGRAFHRLLVKFHTATFNVWRTLWPIIEFPFDSHRTFPGWRAQTWISGGPFERQYVARAIRWPILNRPMLRPGDWPWNLTRGYFSVAWHKCHAVCSAAAGDVLLEGSHVSRKAQQQLVEDGGFIGGYPLPHSSMIGWREHLQESPIMGESMVSG